MPLPPPAFRFKEEEVILQTKTPEASQKLLQELPRDPRRPGLEAGPPQTIFMSIKRLAPFVICFQRVYCHFCNNNNILLPYSQGCSRFFLKKDKKDNQVKKSTEPHNILNNNRLCSFLPEFGRCGFGINRVRTG
jgi:hypothetical protein